MKIYDLRKVILELLEDGIAGLLVALEELFIISHQYVYKRIQVLPVPDGRR